MIAVVIGVVCKMWNDELHPHLPAASLIFLCVFSSFQYPCILFPFYVNHYRNDLFELMNFMEWMFLNSKNEKRQMKDETEKNHVE